MINREAFLCHKIQKTQNMKRGYWFSYLWESSIIKKEKWFSHKEMSVSTESAAVVATL